MTPRQLAHELGHAACLLWSHPDQDRAVFTADESASTWTCFLPCYEDGSYETLHEYIRAPIVWAGAVAGCLFAQITGTDDEKVGNVLRLVPLHRDLLVKLSPLWLADGCVSNSDRAVMLDNPLASFDEKQHALLTVATVLAVNLTNEPLLSWVHATAACASVAGRLELSRDDFAAMLQSKSARKVA